MDNITLAKEDIKYIWHPCTQMKIHEEFPIIPIKSGYGVYLEDFDGNKYIDAISSWWVNLFGHNNSYINGKVKEQLETLEHTIFAGFSHLQAINLAKRVTKLTNMDKVFFADNGSSSVEIAIKLAFHYYKNSGEIRPYILSLQNSYHGETIGALSVSDLGLYRDIYEPILIKNIVSPIDIDKFEEILKTNHHKINSFIFEPFVQCAGGMQMYSEEFLYSAKELCKKYNILMIADEIAVGFGRTGKMFATDFADIMLLSKGLTGGYMPLALVLMKNYIYDSFYCEYGKGRDFLHSHSYTANPIACSAANAVLDIFENDNIIEKNRDLIEYISTKLSNIQSNKIKNIRQKGMICAMDIENLNSFEFRKKASDMGVILRPLGNVVYIMPPYVTSKSEIDTIFEVIETLC